MLPSPTQSRTFKKKKRKKNHKHEYALQVLVITWPTVSFPGARAARAVPQPASRARSRPLTLCPPQPNPAQAGAERRAGIASPGQSERALPPPSRHLEDMEERPAETNASVDDSAPPSVAQLAGRFREQAAAAKKSPPNASHPPKVKVKSSPLIEKLQANLVFDPAALLPGASPKSPGLKAMVSPFHSPPPTPSSPGVWSRASEPEEVPVSFDQPPEGSHLPSYNKVRTRGSIKRRPPSRRFRRSQSEDCADLGGLRAEESSQENGAKEENGDEVFLAKSKTPGSPPLRRTPSWTEKQEEKGRALRVAQQHEKAMGSSEEGASQRPARASSPEAENGGGSPTEEKPAEGQMEEPTEVKERAASEEEEPEKSSQDTEGLEEGAVGKETPQNPPGGGEGDHSSEQGAGKEKQDDGTILEPGCDPVTGHAQPDTNSEVPKTEDNTPVQDTKM
ncbi:capZ-interacting protein isoform X2 [Neophocaena asiaeorientalis asiaeorientalis]|uniref:CapZ-interacting protein isoform X2 n=1 Tax=Neophocaena asiaeorientalis asiaeorientalis TaxID=1706337 RepID=A0A341B5V4_NEOAA|nr:capZ-interacting protein isoform X2 [Neophocaena asiaeorientalis asiaeorientalis]